MQKMTRIGRPQPKAARNCLAVCCRKAMPSVLRNPLPINRLVETDSAWMGRARKLDRTFRSMPTDSDGTAAGQDLVVTCSSHDLAGKQALTKCPVVNTSHTRHLTSTSCRQKRTRNETSSVRLLTTTT